MTTLQAFNLAEQYRKSASIQALPVSQFYNDSCLKQQSGMGWGDKVSNLTSDLHNVTFNGTMEMTHNVHK